MSTKRTPWEITREMFLSLDEVAGLLAVIRAPFAGTKPYDPRLAPAALDRLIIESLLFSGLRCSEFCGLRLADTILGTGQSTFHVGRGESSRTVWVPSHVSTLVRNYARRIRPAFAALGNAPADPSQPLLLGERGRPFDRTALYRRVVRILTAAGLADRASVQLLRHTYGYLAYLNTRGNLLFVQRQLGHSHPMVTSVYAQFVEHSYSELANGIGEIEPAPLKRSSREKLTRVPART